MVTNGASGMTSCTRTYITQTLAYKKICTYLQTQPVRRVLVFPDVYPLLSWKDGPAVRVLAWNLGDMGSISWSTTDFLSDLRQVTESLYIPNFLICKIVFGGAVRLMIWKDSDTVMGSYTST